MAKYRKKPVVIEAVRWRGYSSNLGLTQEAASQPAEITEENMHGINYASIPDWMPEPLLTGTNPDVGGVLRDGDDLLIGTLEGVHRAKPGDWIIRGIKGELYPCKPEIFAATYEDAE